ncbi:MAG: aldehyde ferredoxin oxidoreductase family protein [Fervidicoccaceae archaeon]
MSKLYGYAGRILRINLERREVKFEEVTKELAAGYIGGRGFNIRKLYDEVPPEVHPLSPDNKLMISTGPIAGTGFPLGARVNVSGKSPLTGILGDSNAGGHFGAEMKYAGFDQIILEGKSRKPIYLYITEKSVEFRDAEGIWGKTVSKALDEIIREIGDHRVQVGIVGPASENGVLFGGVFFNRVRPAARTGMGTLMASKNVKAVAVRGDGYVEVADQNKFEKIVDEIEKEVFSHEQFWPRRIMGTTRILLAGNRIGMLPAYHFSRGEVDFAYDVSGEKLAVKHNVKVRGCFSCVVPCSRVYVYHKDGEIVVNEGLEYEALAGMTVRIGNRDLEKALAAVDLLNELGMDVITTSEVISWAMELYERGLISLADTDGLRLNWGNMEAVIELIKQIAKKDGFGKLLSEGVVKAAEKLRKGMELAFHVKRLEMIQADPRALKGYGLGFAVASRGADHLRSEPFIELSDDPKIGMEMFGEPEATIRLGIRGKGRLVAYYENICALVDSLEVCKNLAENMNILNYEKISELFTAVTGISLSPREIEETGERIVNLERAYLVREGIRRKDDSLPSRFLKEPMKVGKSKGQVIELERMLDEYYAARNWDVNTGIPRESTLLRLGLADVVEDLKRRKIELFS